MKRWRKTNYNDENIYSWTSKQTYLVVADMMSAVATLGINSCPIEGFEKEKVEEIFSLDISKYQLSLVLPFGYRVDEQSSQLRLPYDEVVEFIK